MAGKPSWGLAQPCQSPEAPEPLAGGPHSVLKVGIKGRSEGDMRSGGSGVRLKKEEWLEKNVCTSGNQSPVGKNLKYQKECNLHVHRIGESSSGLSLQRS